jgi:hypothetical protein
MQAGRTYAIYISKYITKEIYQLFTYLIGKGSLQSEGRKSS